MASPTRRLTQALAAGALSGAALASSLIAIAIRLRGKSPGRDERHSYDDGDRGSVHERLPDSATNATGINLGLPSEQAARTSVRDIEPNQIQRRIANATIAMAIFSLLLTLANGVGLWFLWQQISISAKALDANERAWMVVQAQGFVPHPQPTPENPRGLPSLQGVMANYGKSPAFAGAHIVRHSFELIQPEVPRPDSDEWREAPGVDLTPGSPPMQAVIFGSFGPKTLRPEDLADVEAGRKTLYLWVFVRYSDPFSEDRFTQHCVRYAPKIPAPSTEKPTSIAGAVSSGLLLCPRRFQIHR